MPAAAPRLLGPVTTRCTDRGQRCAVSGHPAPFRCTCLAAAGEHLHTPLVAHRLLIGLSRGRPM